MVEKLIYLDFETTGLNPEVDKLLTIQWQEIDANTGDELSELRIFKLWDYDTEKKFIEDVIKKIDPIWCIDAINICAPETTVNTPKKI